MNLKYLQNYEQWGNLDPGIVSKDSAKPMLRPVGSEKILTEQYSNVLHFLDD